VAVLAIQPCIEQGGAYGKACFRLLPLVLKLMSNLPLWRLVLPCLATEMALLRQLLFIRQILACTLATLPSRRNKRTCSEREKQNECNLSGEPFLILSLQQCETCVLLLMRGGMRFHNGRWYKTKCATRTPLSVLKMKLISLNINGVHQSQKRNAFSGYANAAQMGSCPSLRY
jgi:hypothetical protein